MKKTKEKIKEYWQEHIRQASLHAGGVRGYCEANGIRRQRLYYYRQKLEGRASTLPAKPFAKVEVLAPTKVTKPCIQLPDPKWLAEFLLALSAGRAL